MAEYVWVVEKRMKEQYGVVIVSLCKYKLKAARKMVEVGHHLKPGESVRMRQVQISMSKQ